MKNNLLIIKKIFFVCILFCIVLMLYACNNAKYELKIEVANEAYEFEEVLIKGYLEDIESKDKIEDISLSYNLSIDSFISIKENKILCNNPGTTKIMVSTTFNKKVYNTSFDFVVKSLALEIQMNDSIYVGKEEKIKAYLNPGNIEVNDLDIVTNDNFVFFSDDNKILITKQGNIEFDVVCTYQGKQYTEKKNLEVITGNLELNSNLPNSIVLGIPFDLDFFMEPSMLVVDDIIVESDNIYTIAINKDGSLIGLSIGRALITAKAIIDNKEFIKSVEVEVVDREYQTEKLILSGSESVYVGKYIAVNCDILPKASVDSIIWSSSDENVAKVNAKGFVTGISEGTAVIKAVSKKNPEIFSEYEVTVLAKYEAVNVNGARYYVEEETARNELPYGVIQYTNSAYSSTPTKGIDVDGYSGITGDIVPNKYYHQQVNILEVPVSKDVQIVSWANWTDDIWSLTTVKGLIYNYERNNPGWKVIAAINGDFFDINALGNLPYQTSGAVVAQGEHYKTSTGNTVGFFNNGSEISLIGNELVERTPNMILSIYDNSGNIVKEFDVQKLNDIPLENETSVYFGTYNSDKQYVPINPNFVNNGYMIENADLALPNNPTDFYGKGTISSTESKELGIGSFAIVTNNEEVNKALEIGLKIRVQYEYIGAYANCMSMTGCGVTLLKNGEYGGAIPEFRAPRTVVGRRSDGTIVMMVIDGRQGNKDMYGADDLEMATIMKAYGCVEAYNLDGGGSSTMVIRTPEGLKVLNSPSDGHERNDSNCLLVVVKEPSITTSVSNITENTATINVSVDDSNNVNELFVLINDEMLKIENGFIEVNDLLSNQLYEYSVYYKDSNGVLNKTLTLGSFTTTKKAPELLGIIIEETDEAFIFTAKYIDVDSSSMIKNFKIDINGLYTFANNGTTTLKKDKVGTTLKDIKISYTYRLLKEDILVEMVDFDYYYIDSRKSN